LAAFGYDLVVDRETRLVASAGGKEEPPPGLELLMQDTLDDLGMIKLSCWSPMLTVGGWISGEMQCRVRWLRLAWASRAEPAQGRPTDVKMIASDTMIRQVVAIHSPTTDKVFVAAPKDYIIASVNHAECVRRPRTGSRVASG
jgi:hypothetical protein